MLQQLLEKAGVKRLSRAIPSAALEERIRDENEGLGVDHGIKESVASAMKWLCLAQDRSSSHDGGVARHYSLLSSWGPSYPETTGYIVPTLLDFGDLYAINGLEQRCLRMLNWLLGLQFSAGGFQGGSVRCKPVVPVTFNTGQVLFGLAAAAARYGQPYYDAMERAAKWLVQVQDDDGCWRKYPSPFARPGDKTYYTHVAWGLLAAARVAQDDRYSDAALKNIHWAISRQQPNGWFADCCLTDPRQPLTHTLGYALRGVLEAYDYCEDPSLLKAALRTGRGALVSLQTDGFLPGRLNSAWQGTVSWACLTGTAQIAHCWLLLYRHSRDPRFRDAAFAANRFVRRTIRLDTATDARGAIKGSFPVFGAYAQYEYVSWAAKFFIDSNLLELAIRRAET